MFLELSCAELELVEHSVACRLQTWRWTEVYLRTGNCDGLIEECHRLSEAKWMVERYETLHQKISNSGDNDVVSNEWGVKRWMLIATPLAGAWLPINICRTTRLSFLPIPKSAR
jgi:hypothetical protein